MIVVKLHINSNACKALSYYLLSVDTAYRITAEYWLKTNFIKLSDSRSYYPLLTDRVSYVNCLLSFKRHIHRYKSTSEAAHEGFCYTLYLFIRKRCKILGESSFIFSDIFTVFIKVFLTIQISIHAYSVGKSLTRYESFHYSLSYKLLSIIEAVIIRSLFHTLKTRSLRRIYHYVNLDK